MPELNGVASKVCVACGVDCTDRPRAKDKRGRYFCRPCYNRAVQKARARQAAPAAATVPASRPAVRARPRAAAAAPVARATAAPVDSLAELAALESRGTAIATAPLPCPSCGEPLPATDRVCRRCGYDRRGVAQPGARRGAAKPARAVPKAAGGGGGGGAAMLTSPLMVSLAQGAVFVALFAIAKMSPGAMLAYAGLWWVHAIAVNIWLVVAAFMTTIVTGILSLLFWPYALYFVLAKNENPYLKGSFLASVFGLVLMIVLLATAAAEVVEEPALAP